MPIRPKSRLRRHLPLLVVPTLLALSGCQPLVALLGALAQGGAPGGMNPSSLGSLPPGANGLPNPLGGAQQTPSPAGSVPPAGNVQALTQKYQITVGGACAQGAALQSLEAGLGLYSQAQRFRGLDVQLPCADQQSTLGLWETNGQSARMTLYVQNGQVFKHTVAHEVAHHMLLAPTNQDVSGQVKGTIGQGQEFYPSRYSRTSKDEQEAEVVSFCKEEPRGGSDIPPDTQGWRCPSSTSPTVASL